MSRPCEQNGKERVMEELSVILPTGTAATFPYLISISWLAQRDSV